jgi:hypothetical protein
MAEKSGDEQKTLNDLWEAVEVASSRLDDRSSWKATFDLLKMELAEGQPFFFKVASARSDQTASVQ